MSRQCENQDYVLIKFSLFTAKSLVLADLEIAHMSWTFWIYPLNNIS